MGEEEVVEKKRRKKKSRSEKWKDGGGGRGEMSATSIGHRAFVLVDDVAGLVHYPCVILIVFTLRLIDAR